jgi:hypothetical protein
VIIDWRPRRYRGGSRWISAGIFVIAVGVAPPDPADGDIVRIAADVTHVTLPDEVRTIEFAATATHITVPDERRQVWIDEVTHITIPPRRRP